jgi:UDP-N-acetylmuramoyl-tripeptide--D-alanyl-D-alanine ligase
MQIETLYQKFLESTGVTTDTRHIAAGNIFFALKGEKFNANQFASAALDSGAAFAVIDELPAAELQNKYADRFILVEDVLKTLQALAAHHRRQFKCPLLAITGSNGKTTTKELAAAVLSKKYKTYFTKGNLNNHIGIPLTLLAVKADAEFIIIEMGANHVGEIGSYCQYVMPTYGLITNVGLAHTEGFGGFEGVVKGKTELYNYLGQNNGTVFICSGHVILKSKIPADVHAVFYGTETEAFCRGEILENNSLLALGIWDGHTRTDIQTNLVGGYNFENVLAAACIGKYFGVGIEAVKQAIEAYTPSNNRSQQIRFGSNTVILDAYNANPSSVTEALKNFEKVNAPNKMVILGEMMELGDLSRQEHERIAAQVNGMHLTKRIFTGAGYAFLKDEPGVIYFDNSGQLKQWFQAQKFDNSWLLVKGSRKNELEKLFKN